MDFAIDRTGRVDPKHEARYKEFGNWLKRCYSDPVASAAVAGHGTGIYNISFADGIPKSISLTSLISCVADILVLVRLQQQVWIAL